MDDIKKINDLLVRVYEMLEFTPEEIKGAVSDLGKAQQLAGAAELLKSLTADEAKAISGAVEKSDVEKQAVMEQIAKAHVADDDFKARAQAEAQKVLDDHIAYLKTRGDDGQKEAIAGILAEIG